MEQADVSPWRRPPAAAKHVNRSESSLAKLRMTGGGPRYSKVGRLILYDIQDLDRWVAANMRHSTGEEPSESTSVEASDAGLETQPADDGANAREAVVV